MNGLHAGIAALAEITEAAPPAVTRVIFSEKAPTAMIFIPCRQGWSHRPDEYASPSQIDRGVAVLAASAR